MPENSNTPSPGDPAGGVADPSFWTQRYQEKDTPWDKGTPHPELLSWLQMEKVGGRVLVPGCGSGHDARALAAQATEVVGLDFSPAAIESALQHASPANVSFTVGDFLKGEAQPLGKFDWIIEHTCFCAIYPEHRSLYLREAAQCLKPDGKLWGIFFLEPDNDGQGPPFGIAMEELSQLVDGHFEIEESWMPFQTFPGRENRELTLVLRRVKTEQ